MSRFAHPHVAALHRRTVRCAWASFWLSLGVLGGLAAVLTVHSLRRVPELGGFVGVYPVESPPAELQEPAELYPQAPDRPWEGEVAPLPLAEVLPPALAEAELPELPPLQEPSALEWSEPAPPPPPRRATAARAVPTPVPARAAAPLAGEGEPFTPPAYLRTPEPPYPPAMRRNRIEGSVRLRILLDAQGAPQQVEIVSSSGHSEFDTTAHQWVLQRWRFTPARRGAQAVPGAVVTSVRFVLN